jgi:hypothetical protein
MQMKFNVVSGLWLYLFLLAFVSAMNYILNKWAIPGLTELHNSVFGNQTSAA